MSNRFKIKKSKTKEVNTDKSTDIKEPKHSAKFLTNKREKGTKTSNFSGKTSKEFSRKKT